MGDCTYINLCQDLLLLLLGEIGHKFQILSRNAIVGDRVEMRSLSLDILLIRERVAVRSHWNNLGVDF